MKTVNDIRNEFLGFFESKGHRVIPSSPLVPQNDPSLMFTNAGMVQFKDVFTGKEKRDYKRAATSQKCVRAGGKHNDLENVGYTARHHTFFEMLGNFSFGDYFKQDAIAFAWELVTKNFGLSPERLLVTVHSSDEEAAAIWRKVTGFPDSKVIRIPTSDNFWAMGDTGPCGPCTEIFFDHGDKIAGGPPGSENADGDRFIEIWNNVFMQFEQVDKDTRIDLPAPSVDTGMGLERIAAILQGKHNNYDIDLLRAIIEHSSDLTKTDSALASHKVIADHLRACAFLMADGVMPSNEGRGYVLRRIMRRGMRHAHLLGADEPLMHKLIPTLVAQMGQAYPELKRAEAMVSATLENEEARFKKTLEQGLSMLEEEAAKIPSGKKLSGAVAFKLYDTFGFPVDLTQDALKEKGIAVDMDGFNAAMDKQRAQARAAWAGSGDTATEKLWFDVLEQHGGTEFLGYASEEAEAQILCLIKDGKVVKAASEGDTVQIIVNQTPFYAESGGQVGDTGVILTARGSKLIVKDTLKKVGALWVHVCELVSGNVNVGEAVQLRVDHDRRTNIRAHHSVTHLLHKALKQTLGAHISQKGSLQDDHRTRFDVSHNAPVSPAEIKAVEEAINRQIRINTPVETRLMPVDDAIASGAEALFGEKYDAEVRVLTMGMEEGNPPRPYSVELCGGTHVSRTGDIGLFKIVGQSAVSAGVRRIEGVAGRAALEYLNGVEDRLMETAQVLKSSPAEVVARVRALTEEKKKLEAELSTLRRQLATGGAGASSNDDVKNIGGVKFIARVLPGIPAKDLKGMADELKKKLGSGVVALIATDEGKASIVVGVTDDLTHRISAVELVKVGAQALGGTGGGGRPDMAQAGGPNIDAAPGAVTALESKLAG